jgi:hypothetical protein
MSQPTSSKFEQQSQKVEHAEDPKNTKHPSKSYIEKFRAEASLT